MLKNNYQTKTSMTGPLVPLAMCLIDQFIDHWRIIVENLIMVANKRKAFKHLKVSRWLCWCLHYCSVFMLKFGQALGKDIISEFLSRIQSLSLVKILLLKFGQDIEGDNWPGSSSWLLPVFARPRFPDCNHIVGRQLQKEKTGICLNALFVSKKLLKYKIQKVCWIVWFM